ncbi:aminopeptidase [Candidatus Pacearchaeota archaeon]|nr:aminopeptidase [Candidatus Pacearchaeota archaeon]
MGYAPSKEVLEKYADVLVNFALNQGKGIRKGEIVFLQIPECAKPILKFLIRAVLKAGGNCIVDYSPEGLAKEFYDNADEKQLNFFPDKFLKGKVEQAGHFLSIISTINPRELQGINPKKIMIRQKVFKPYMEWRNEKENKGKFSWTLGLYGTEPMAKEAGLDLEEYWNQIIKACYLREKNPVEKWKSVSREINEIILKLNKMSIEKVHIKTLDSDNINLIVGIGKNRKWLGGRGNNIPSFEIFISPDCRITTGRIKFNQPLYRYGSLVKGISLEFKNGKVVKASAKSGENILKEMIKVENADKIGEFSLTDIKFSKIDKFMAETLFDENIGGNYGNSHIALGNAYKDSYTGNPSKVSKAKWKEMGYNESVIHTDIISTENKEVTAFLEDGSRKVIYRNGHFLI